MNNFSFEKLKSLPSFAQRINYVASMLPKLGSGSSRTAFKLDDTKVIKVAKNKKGLAQNEAEANPYLQREYSIVARVFDSDFDDIFLLMEYAPKPKPSEFAKIIGASLQEVEWWLTWQNNVNKGLRRYTGGLSDERLLELSENEFLMDLYDMAYNYNFPVPGDFGRISTYGKVIRDGQEDIVIIDFGLTDDVANTHYRRK